PSVSVAAGRPAVAHRGRPFAAAQPAAEDRDHAGLAEWVLPGAVDVAQAQGHPGEAVETLVEGEVALGGELALAVGGERLDRRVLAQRQRLSLALAVDRP